MFETLEGMQEINSNAELSYFNVSESYYSIKNYRPHTNLVLGNWQSINGLMVVSQVCGITVHKNSQPVSFIVFWTVRSTSYMNILLVPYGVLVSPYSCNH